MFCSDLSKEISVFKGPPKIYFAVATYTIMPFVKLNKTKQMAHTNVSRFCCFVFFFQLNEQDSVLSPLRRKQYSVSLFLMQWQVAFCSNKTV